MFGPHTTPPAERFSCAIERTSEAMLLRPVGEVDLETVPMLWSNLKAMLEDNLNIIVDLKGIQDIDSGIKALRTLISSSFQRGQRFVVSEPNAICRKLFGAEKTHPASGEIMVGGTMSMPMTSGMSMTSAMAMDTRHLEVHVSSRATGKVVTTARCAITVINSATKKRMSVPVTMYGVKEGLADRHYGNNVSMPPGDYDVVVVVNGEQAVFHVTGPKM